MGRSLGLVVRSALRRANRLLPPARGGVTVLAYHLVGGGTAAAVDLQVEAFRAQLDELASGGRVVPLAQALESLAGGDGDDRHHVVLTFDDAFRNFHEIVWPLLEERRLPAVLYVPVGFVDGSSPPPLTGAEELPPMTWPAIREVAASGLVTLGSHSLSHPDLRRLADTDCREELRRSRTRLEDETGAPVTSFCYPRALWTPAVRRLVATHYDSAAVAGGRRNRRGAFDPHRIYRIPIRRDMPAGLGPVLDKAVWLEEWVAAGWRRLAR